MSWNRRESAFPAVQWNRRDWMLFAAITALSCLLFWSGLSIRALWGPEGRWAMIVREMLQSGNYFIPTVNGVVDMDKPLLSYWLILPFAKAFGLSELTLRIPGTLAAIGVVLLVFAIGRRLFGYRSGLAASLVLLASPMFVFWGRTASADLWNTLAIWALFWLFLAGAFDGDLQYLILFYGTGAIASFLKGPVAPAVSFASLGLYSCAGVLIQYKKQYLPRNHFTSIVTDEFRWIATRQAFAGLMIGGIIFSTMLCAPALISGSWTSLSLMWKENVVRFFAPFDHIRPPYTYMTQILLFSAPWSVFALASLFNAKGWKPGREGRWIILSALGIFLFFTLSASRRSYYILPLVPAVALITGKSLVDWIDGGIKMSHRVMHIAAVITSILVVLAGATLIYIYVTMEVYRHASLLLMAPIVMAGGIGTFLFFMKNKYLKGLTLIIVVIILFQFWAFTVGSVIMERTRTLRTFAQEVRQNLEGVKDDRIFIYQYGAGSLLYYLKRPSPVKNVNNLKEIEEAIAKYPDGYLIVDMREATTLPLIRCLNQMVLVREQVAYRSNEHFVLLKFHETLNNPH